MDRGKVFTAEDLNRLVIGGFKRYKDVDGDGIAPRTLPGTEHPLAAYFTRGTGHDESARLSERPEDWGANMERLTRKFETARTLVPRPVEERVEGAQVAIIAYGSTDFAVSEAREMLAKQGIKTSYMRLRALPLPEEAKAFVAAHDLPVQLPAAGADGWIRLFDGTSPKGWHAAGGGPFPKNWKVEDGCLKAMPDDAPVPASIVTDALYTDFELDFEWKLFRDSNSGVKYRILLEIPLEGGWYDIANEYQLLDDTGPVAKTLPPDGLTGSLYDVLAPEKEASKPLGEWNRSRLVVRSGHITHWLNGEKVVEYDVDQDFASPLLLQNHGTECWFRNIRLQPQ